MLNKLDLPQGLHAPFVATAALVIFALAQTAHGSGFLAVYIAGLVVGNSSTRAHNTVVVFLDAATWLAQIAMFVLLGLLAWPHRLAGAILPGLAVAAALMPIARPAAVFRCLAPFRFSLREKLFISWVACMERSVSSSPRSLVGRAAECPPLLRRGLHRRAGVAAGAGLDHRAGGAASRRFVSPQ